MTKIDEYDVDFNGAAAFPRILSGKTWHAGWNIPTLWAIDSNKQCWANDAHGGAIKKVTEARLLSEISDQYQRDAIRKILGKKPELPIWVKFARVHGWTPPTGWDESQWDET